MTISLYDVSVRSYIQTLTGTAGYLDKAAKHFEAAGKDPNSVLDLRLFDDMLPFKFQVLAVAHHSMGAIEGCRAGVFNPPPPKPGVDYKGLQGVVADALAGLKGLSEAEVNGLEGKDVEFQMGAMKIPFVAEGFLMSFSLPNLHFHATTGYDILRIQGVPLGKRDYMGPLRMKA